MGQAIRHRGPDGEGIWSEESAGLVLVHRRLAIIDLSPAGHQPMASASGRYVIAFNGEIYNFGEIRKTLETEGRAPRWRGHSDTEILLEAIAAWGLDSTLARTAGMFAFALWDRESRTLSLARDRLGEKPLYYGWNGTTFLFGSDFAALREHPEWQGEIDRDALSLMMRYNNVPAPHAIYRGFRKLRPGHALVLDARTGRSQERQYWDIAGVAQAALSDPFLGTPAEATNTCESLIRQSLAGQMIADVPLGAFLSGGVDSSCIVALMSEMSAAPVKTFTIGFREAGYDEAGHAKAVAKHLGTDHHEVYVSPEEARAVIPSLPGIYSEPFADSSQIPTFLVSRLARRHVTVSLSGDGGDEVFCGYRRYAYAARVWPRLARIPRPLRAAAARAILGVGPRTWDRLAGRSRHAGERLHKAARVMAKSNRAEVYDALVAHWSEDIVIGANTVPGTGEAAPSDAVRAMMLRDTVGYLPDDILVKVDRASMAVSLESRIPLLDHRLVEFAWRLPVSILRHGGQSKWPLREILYRRVPRELIERPKSGFAVPLAGWLRGPLRDWAEGLIGEQRLRREGFFEPGPIRAAWTALLEGEAATQERIWNVLMFQAWHEHLASACHRATATATQGA